MARRREISSPLAQKTGSIACALLACLLAALLSSTATAEDVATKKPQRIVSINVCTDQLLMLLVSRSRVAAVTDYAANPAMSAFADKGEGLPVTHGSAEHVILLKPDLVLAGTFSNRTTVHLLKRLGMKVVLLSPASNFEDIYANIRTIGAAVGEERRAKELIRQMKDGLADAPSRSTLSKPVAAPFYTNSYSSGKGTLVDAVLSQSGFSSLGAKTGFSGTRKIGLEMLIMSKPDALILGHRRFPGDALAYEVFQHPALQRMKNLHPTASIADALTVCGSPRIVQAVSQLRAFYAKNTQRWRPAPYSSAYMLRK